MDLRGAKPFTFILKRTVQMMALHIPSIQFITCKMQ